MFMAAFTSALAMNPHERHVNVPLRRLFLAVYPQAEQRWDV